LVNSELVPRPDIRFRIVSKIENSGGEMDVVGSSRMSRAALAPFRRTQIAQRRTGAARLATREEAAN
jgi:hypothetical protein